MNVVYPNLNNQIMESRTSLDKLSNVIDCTIEELEQKLQGIIPWLLSDVVNICVFFKRTDAEYLFVQLDNTIHKLESQENFGST